MIDTTFVPGITPITATWLNEANDTLVALGTAAGASTIGCIPTGTVSANTVQGAIAQLAGQVAYTDANTRATLLTGLVTGSSSNVSATDSILTAFGKVKFFIDQLNNSAVTFASGKINFLNTGSTVTSYMQNTASVARTYTFPDKDGTVAMVSDIPTGAGSTVLLSTATIGANVATIDYLNIFSSTYDRYIIDIQGLGMWSTADAPTLRVAIGGTALTTNSYHTVTADNSVGTASSVVILTGSNLYTGASSYGMTARIEIANVNSTTRDKSFTVLGSYGTPTPDRRGIIRVGSVATNSVVSGFRIATVSGNTLSSGTISIYGITK